MIQTVHAPAPAPLYVELARSLEELVEPGTLRPGHRLPSVRRMSLQRDVSISTVLQAGCPLAHDELVITVGCAEAINLALRAVTKPGDTVAVETPTCFGFLETIQSLNLRVMEIPTGARTGLCLDTTRDALVNNDIKAVLLIPSFQNPLGSCMPDANREKRYRILAAFDIPAIEDDVYGC